MQISDRQSLLGTETAFEVLAKARALEAQGKNIVHLEIGEPDFDTPKNIRERAKKALDEGYTHYGPSAGLPEARKAVAEESGKMRGVEYSPDEVVFVPGAKPIIFFGILATTNPGDEVIYPNPGFPIYESMIRYVGGKAVPYPLSDENDFRFRPEEIEKLVTPKTKMIILNTPANPTGGVVEKKDVEAVAETAKKHNLWVMSDEVYDRILYEGKHYSIASEPEMKERTIVIDGFSKTYAMTGWRAGYGIMNKTLAPHVTRLMTNSNSCTASFTQVACVEALKGPQESVTAMVAEFKKRRDIIVDGFNKIPGVKCRKPKGAFYVFPNVKELNAKLKMNSQQLSDFMMYEANVACLPGTSFGKYGEGYLRFSYANSIPNIQEALKRIRTALEKKGIR